MATFTRLPSGSWRAHVCVHGVRKSATKKLKGEARAWALSMEESLSSGSPIEFDYISLADLFTRYELEVSVEKSGRFWEADRFRVIGAGQLGGLALSEITREHIEGWIAWRLESVKSSTVNRELNLLSACFTQARRWRLMTHNPMADLQRPKNPPARDRRVSNSEIERLKLASWWSETEPLERPSTKIIWAFLIAIETAMRLGEILSITPEAISIKKSVARLERTKNGHARDVPLSPRAMELLRMLPWVARQPLYKTTATNAGNLFGQICKRAGIVGLTFHDSRHEAITRLADKIEVLDLARMVGHRDIKQLMTYYNKTAEDIAKLLR